MEFIGWLGSIPLALCGLPQALKCYHDKRSKGMAWGFLWAWFIGEILVLTYVVSKLDWPLIFNCLANILFVGIIIYFKLYPGKKNENFRS